VITLVRMMNGKAKEVFQAEGTSIRIGRARGNDIVLDSKRDRVVSNYHAEIRKEGKGWFLYDLQSTHGTYVNEQHVQKWRLQEGDIIGLASRMGGPLLKFSLRVSGKPDEVRYHHLSRRLPPSIQSPRDPSHRTRIHHGDVRRDGPRAPAALARRAVHPRHPSDSAHPEPVIREEAHAWRTDPEASALSEDTVRRGHPEEGSALAPPEPQPEIPLHSEYSEGAMDPPPMNDPAPEPSPTNHGPGDEGGSPVLFDWQRPDGVLESPDTMNDVDSTSSSEAFKPPEIPTEPLSNPSITPDGGGDEDGERHDAPDPRDSRGLVMRLTALFGSLLGGKNTRKDKSEEAPRSDERYFKKPFVLEEAIKERRGPELDWMARHQWLLRFVILLTFLGFWYQEKIAVWLALLDAPSGPVFRARDPDAPLIDPPGSRNVELMRAVQALYAQASSLPPIRVDDGDRTLKALRPVVRRLGEDPMRIPMDLLEAVRDEIDTMTKDRRLELIYRRSIKQRAMMREELEQASLPEVYRFIPWIETGYESSFKDGRTQRAGMWALTKKDAIRHGLVVNEERDERLDPRLSTRAAASYLIELIGEVQRRSFTLALCAYREGPFGARTILTAQPTWRLSDFSLSSIHRRRVLSSDMHHYLVRVLAAASIAETPVRFGLPPEPL